MDSLTIRDRTRGLVSDKRAHVERLRQTTARLQADLFGPFPSPETDAPSVAREDSIEGDLMWLMELNQDTRNALDVLDGIIDKISPTNTKAGSSPERTYASPAQTERTRSPMR